MLEHKGTKTIETERLIIRKITLNDAEMMFKNWATDEKTTKYTAWSPHKNIEETRSIIEKWTAEYEQANYYNWTIEFMGEPIGGSSLHSISEKSLRGEIGYCIGSKWWNRGIVTEAARAIVAFAFEEVGFNKICALHDTENAASGRVMQKIGMVQEGFFKKHSLRKDGTWGDMAFYSIWR